MTMRRLGRVVAPVLIAALALGVLAAPAARAEGHRPPPRGLVVDFRQLAPPAAAGQTLRHIVDAVEGDEIALTAIFTRDGRASISRIRTFRFYVTSMVERGTEVFVIRLPVADLARLSPTDLGRSVTVQADWLRATAPDRAEALAKLQSFRRSSFTVAIHGRERITVPAGTFDTVVLSRSAEWRDEKSGKTVVNRLRIWLDPELGWYVRMEETWAGGEAPPRIAEAIQIVRPR